MNKILSAIGKKNIIIMSGILLIGVAVYLNLNLDFEVDPSNNNSLDSDYGEYDNSKLGQAALVGNQNNNNGNEYLNVNLEDFENYGEGYAYSGEELLLNQNENNENSEALNAENNSNVLEERDNYFAVSVVSRQRARDESIELLNNIANNAEAFPDVRDRALSDIAVIAQEIEREANIETLIRAKGFNDCVAVVSGENANVIVKTDGLMPNEVAQIKEIVYEQAKIMPANVKIVEKN